MKSLHLLLFFTIMANLRVTQGVICYGCLTDPDRKNPEGIPDCSEGHGILIENTTEIDICWKYDAVTGSKGFEPRRYLGRGGANREMRGLPFNQVGCAVYALRATRENESDIRGSFCMCETDFCNGGGILRPSLIILLVIMSFLTRAKNTQV